MFPYTKDRSSEFGSLFKAIKGNATKNGIRSFRYFDIPSRISSLGAVDQKTVRANQANRTIALKKMGCLRIFAKLFFVIKKALVDVATKVKKSDKAVENGRTNAKQHQLMIDILPSQSFIALNIFSDKPCST
jgi:hypothetical protein